MDKEINKQAGAWTAIIFLILSTVAIVYAANDFSGDTHIKAVWNLDSAALTTDSKGTNTLTNVGVVVADTVNKKQGTASATNFVDGVSYLSIADGSLDAGFPLKNGDTNKKISIAQWVRFDEFAPDQSYAMFFSKWGSGGNTRSFLVGEFTDGTNEHIRFCIGTGTGDGSECKDHATDIGAITNAFIHVTVTFQDSDKTFAIRLRDASCALIGSDLASTTTANINVETGPVEIGQFNDSAGGLGLTNNIDEVVVSDEVWSAAQSNAICAATAGATTTTSTTTTTTTTSTTSTSIIPKSLQLLGVGK